MSWQDHPTHRVPTSVGELEVVISGGSSAYDDDDPYPMHAYVRTNPFELNVPDSQRITIRGIDHISVSFRLEQAETGLWSLAADSRGWTGNAIGGYNVNGAPMTSAAKRWLEAKLVPELEQWLLTHPELVDEGRVISARQNAHTLGNKVAETEVELATLRARLSRLDTLSIAEVAE